jgi:SHS family lactate transporter-like MFS transporter
VAAWFMLDRFGWRSLFLLGGLPALLALFIRVAIRESEIWQKNRAESWSQLGREIASHWKVWIYLTMLMAMMNLSSHGTQDMFPTFMESFRGMNTKTYSQVVIVMMTGAILGGVAFGWASDRLGRKAMMIAAFLGALLVTPLWAFSSTMAMILCGAFLMQFMVQGAWGIIPAHLSELSPDRVRGFLPGFSYQCGNLIAASIAVLQAGLAKRFDYSFVMATSAAIIFVFAIVITAVGRERRGDAFGVDGP